MFGFGANKSSPLRGAARAARAQNALVKANVKVSAAPFTEGYLLSISIAPVVLLILGTVALAT